MYQGRLSGALAPQNQDLFRIIGLADLRYIIPVGEGPIPNLRGADGDLSPVKVNDVTFWGVQRFKAVAPQIVAAAEYRINGLSDCGLDVPCALLPVVVGIVDLFADGLVLNQPKPDIGKMACTVQNPTVPQLLGSGFPAGTPADDDIQLLTEGGRLDDIVNMSNVEGVKGAAVHSNLIFHARPSHSVSPPVPT